MSTGTPLTRPPHAGLPPDLVAAAPEIRRASRADVAACARIVSDWEHETPYLDSRAAAPVIEAHITEVFDQREIWVTGTPVDGYMSIDPRACKLGAIYLRRRGEGLGRQLIEIAKEGRDFLWLTVYEANHRARAFYRREGFRQITPSLSGAGLLEGPPRALRMEWER
jgi:GNAT superfamily N-acetyltransferase